MALKAVIFLVFSYIHLSIPHPIAHPSNWLRQCRAMPNLSIPALEVLPGGGWDNLRNIDMGRVMNLSYSQCQTTEDGFYLIPDEVFVIPQKETGVETNSEIISSWLEQKSSTSSSINTDVSFDALLNAKFSAETQRMKTHQVKDASTTTRVQVRIFLYTVKAFPDFTLDSRFAEQAEAIADAIINNQTRQATYLSEKMVLDYGTHVITSVDAGAALVQEDYLLSSYVSDSKSDRASITVSAGLNFFDKLKFDISSKDTQESSALKTYLSNIQYSLIKSHGGAPFYPGITLQKWQESTSNNLASIDRSGLPLHYFINPTTFPNLPEPIVGKLSSSVFKAIKTYYKINTHPGCVNVGSPNFNFQANLDDKSCEGPATNLSFGGVYQRCVPISADADPLCQTLAQKNLDTGDYSCRAPYFPTLLRSEMRQQTYSKNLCQKTCYSCGFLGWSTCCETICSNVYFVRSVTVETYWCSIRGKAGMNSGYLFGGIYSPSLVNPITKTKSCPLDFIPVKFLSDGQVICVSNDYETGPKYSVPFGGLFSCESTNPLAWDQRRCPAQFSQHLATVSDGCEILYCVQSGLFTGGQLLPIRLPPYTRPPVTHTLATNTVMVMTEGELSWVRVAQTKMWKLATPEESSAMARLSGQGSGQMSVAEMAGVVFGGGVLVVVGAIIIRRRWRRSGYESLNDARE
ncbi:macrophage-expressed gene 1 protein-like [Aplochiton taeniatus]